MKTSKFKSKKDWLAASWQRLLKDIKNPGLSAALDSLLSPYEKSIIVNRLAAVSLIKKGRTYQQIGEELWLSPTTIRCIKKVLEDNAPKEYQSYRLRNSKRLSQSQVKKGAIEPSGFINWIDYCESVFPRKNGPRWKFFK